MTDLEKKVDDLLMKYIMKIPGSEQTRWELRQELVQLILDNIEEAKNTAYLNASLDKG